MKILPFLNSLFLSKKVTNSNQEWALAGNRDELDLHNFTQFLKKNFSNGLTYIDVGAHEGRYISAVLENTKTKFPNIHAFEANPKLFQILRNKFPLINLTNIAISDKSDSVKFNICNYDGLSALTIRKKGLPLGAKYEEIEILSSSLDSLFNADTRIDLIKIDVEGSEFEVLRGSIELIRRSQPIILIEHGPTEDTVDATSSIALYEMILQIGYAIYTIDGLKITSKEEWLDVYFNHSIWNYWLIGNTQFVF